MLCTPFHLYFLYQTSHSPVKIVDYIYTQYNWLLQFFRQGLQPSISQHLCYVVAPAVQRRFRTIDFCDF